MKDLIKALEIILKFLKDPESEWPTACEHDTLYVCGVNLEAMSAADVRQLCELGFNPGTDDDYSTIEDILGHDFSIEGNWENVTDEQWDQIKGELTDAMWSYRYGSC